MKLLINDGIILNYDKLLIEFEICYELIKFYYNKLVFFN